MREGAGLEALIGDDMFTNIPLIHPNRKFVKMTAIFVAL